MKVAELIQALVKFDHWRKCISISVTRGSQGVKPSCEKRGGGTFLENQRTFRRLMTPFEIASEWNGNEQ